jgi:CheY-like chemotaxis protein
VNDFSAVVTDLRMPGADGLASCTAPEEPQTIKSSRPRTRHRDGGRCAAAGRDRLRAKPVIFDDLLGKIARLDHRQAV